MSHVIMDRYAARRLPWGGGWYVAGPDGYVCSCDTWPAALNAANSLAWRSRRPATTLSGQGDRLDPSTHRKDTRPMRDQLKSLTTRTRNAARKAGNWLREAGHAAGYIIRIGVTKGDRADKLILTLFAVMTIVNLIVAIITPSMNTWGNVLGSIAFWLLYVLLSFHTFHTYKFAEELERYQGIFRRITDAAEERGGKATFNVTIHDVETFIGLARKRDDEKATESTESTPETV